jgi:hypothetical protein
MQYKIYKQNEITQDKEYKTILFKESFYEAILRINPIWTNLDFDNSKVGHLEFFALSIGWENFTETGYKSIFFYHDNYTKYIDDNSVIEIFLKELETENFIFKKSHQLQLF